MEGNSRWPDFAISNIQMQFLHLSMSNLDLQNWTYSEYQEFR